MKHNRFLKKFISNMNDKGTTLVEMVVCFALIAIFLTAASSVILLISNMYYEIKGESYAKQVMDIVIGKVSSEIEGAKYNDKDFINNLVLDGDASNIKGTRASMYDKTDTKVELRVNTEGYLEIYYYPIEDEDVNVSRSATVWKYSDKMYNGFYITDFEIIKAKNLNDYKNLGSEQEQKLQKYDVTTTGTYGDNVLVVLMTMKSDRYGEYKTCRFVKMYNAPDVIPDTGTGL